MAYRKQQTGRFTKIINDTGKELSFIDVPVLEVDGLAFKDLERCGKLLPYEDWRLTASERAKDLASRLSIQEIAGLMLYSSHQFVPFENPNFPAAHYHGKKFDNTTDNTWDLTDELQTFILTDHIRHILLAGVKDAKTAACWNNEMQSLAEKQPHGIPIVISSDPRHGVQGDSAEFKTSGTDVSKWPNHIGLAAIFSLELCLKYAKIVAKEYRALGITTALSPQVDLATEPRWMRYEDTFGGNSDLSIAMSKAYCDGLQTTEGIADGWGKDSVAAMSKHWPGGGTGEGGRDAHYAFGQYAVYPGGKFETHLKSFTEGAFRLDGPTGTTAAIMPYYTVSWNRDKKENKNQGNSYSPYIIRDLLRGKYKYDGIICTDWGITGKPLPSIEGFGPRCYGVQNLTEAQQHLQIIMNGVDQFGGNNSAGPVLEAYEEGCEKYGKKTMDSRMRESAFRLLRNMFRVNLFDDPYLDSEESTKIVGCEAYRTAGYKAQLASVVMLKNSNDTLPLRQKLKIYIPDRYIKERKTFMRTIEPARKIHPVSDTISKKYFDLVDSPDEANAAVVFMESPSSNPYSEDDLKNGGNGYLPISLQYRPYTAKYARKTSIAGGDPREESANRSYCGKTNTTANEKDLDILIETKQRMGNKPVVVCLAMHNPTVPSEFEPYADAILVDFGVEKSALFDIITGKHKPEGRLPVNMPKDMKMVELHCEDIAEDIEPYKDSSGNVYRFGFGLDWNGPIESV